MARLFILIAVAFYSCDAHHQMGQRFPQTRVTQPVRVPVLAVQPLRIPKVQVQPLRIPTVQIQPRPQILPIPIAIPRPQIQPRPQPQPQPAGPTCDVGEQEKVSGLCSNGNGKCDEYCRSKYGGELLGSGCSVERPNKQRECICKLKCCNIGCWGDPHCWTCDGVRFGYQGLKKHVLMKPIKNYPSLPLFEIRQINKLWKGGPMSMLDESELFVSSWTQTIRVKMPDGPNGYILTVNGNVQNIPYRYSAIEDNRERFISVVYADAGKSTVVVTTSFGLRITYTTKPRVGIESDISIDFPRHPELKDNSHGLLGRWNGNPDDDAIDANGKKQVLDNEFSWAFGDSWILLDEGRTKTPECVRNDAIDKKEQKINDLDAEKKARAEALCTKALESSELRDCAKKLGRPVPLVKSCANDLFFGEENQWEEYVKETVDGFLKRCNGKPIGDDPDVGFAFEANV